MKLRCYIAGPMTGYPGMNFDAFHAAAKKLRAQGWIVVNPAEINDDVNADRIECLRADITALATCSAVAFLPGWDRSKGALLESHIADELDLIRIHLD